MRCDHDVRSCACTKRAAQVSIRRRAGSRNPFGRNRSASKRARSRYRRNAQNSDSDSKSYFNRCAESPTAWKNSGSNYRIYPATLRDYSEQVDGNCHFEPITESTSDRIIKRSVVSSVDYRAKSSKATALGLPSSLNPDVSTRAIVEWRDRDRASGLRETLIALIREAYPVRQTEVAEP